MRILSGDVRPAKADDAEKIANVHWRAWQHTYAGIIPHAVLQRMITERNLSWWRRAIARPRPVPPCFTPSLSC